MDRVFHVAGITSMRPADRERVFEVNVGGTRNVIEEARGVGVQRVAHVLGRRDQPAKPNESADETQPFTGGRLGISYINSKHEAEQEAMRYAERGWTS